MNPKDTQESASGRAQRHWASLMARLGNPPSGREAFGIVVALYGQRHRAYHNLTHIVAMLDAYEETGGGSLAVLYAIWLHDIVYDPRAKDNERRSAESAENLGRAMNVPCDVRKKSARLILATRHDSMPTDRRAQQLADLDLMVLGGTPQEFDAYEAAIREEYAWVSEREFRAGRAKILHSFLSRPKIYATPRFQARYEAKARTNIERSLARLQG